MSSAEPNSEKPPGILAENYSEVLGLQSCLARTEPDIGLIPRLLQRVIRDGCWREFLTPNGEVVRWNAADFRLFLTGKRPEGCETPLEIIEKILEGTDAWVPYYQLTRGTPGGLRPDQSRNDEGSFIGRNRDPITVAPDKPSVMVDVPSTFPISQGNPRSSRDRSREAPTGTSISYAIRRLGKERPDLLERVKSGELKPKSAMREAGFIPLEFSIPVEPQGAARRILNRFRGEPLLELIRVLANHAGGSFVEPNGDDSGHQASPDNRMSSRLNE